MLRQEDYEFKVSLDYKKKDPVERMKGEAGES